MTTQKQNSKATTITTRFKSPTSLQRFIKEQRCNRLAILSYLDDSLVSNKDIHWLFVLTFPNGGSTALAKLLLTAPSTLALNSNAEGQWLIPSLCKKGVRWDVNHHIWKRKIRAVWLNRAAWSSKKIGTKPTLVIEKSPPNMCRYQEIVAAFNPMNTYLVTFSRDPYATCASWHRRYGLEKIVEQWHPSGKSLIRNESDYFRFLGKIWIERANMLLQARRDAILNISYEEFSDNTGGVIKRLGDLIPQLKNISTTAKVKVKDYDEQEIINMNEKQIELLSNVQISAISSALIEAPDILEQLGYSIL